MKHIFLILFILFSISLFADQIDLLSSYWDFYSQNYNSYYSIGLGMSTVAEIGNSGFINQNPASVDVKFQNINLSVGYKNNISLSDTLSIKPRYPLLSANYAIDYKNKFDFGFSFDTIKNFQIKNSMTDNNSYLSKKNLFYKEINYTFTANYKSFKYARIGFGLIIKSILLDEETEAAYIDRFKKSLLIYKAGLILTPIKQLNLGFTYKTSSKFTADVLNSDDETQSEIKKVLPTEMNVGIKFKLKNFSFYYQYEIENTSKDFYLTKDKTDHHIGTSYKYNKAITITGGFFTNNVDYQLESADIAPNLPVINKEFFVSGGILLNPDDSFEIGLSVADSHFSNAYTPKTYILLGFSFSMMSLF